MLTDQNIIKAISSISQRAERQRDLDKILNSYVEVGILPQLLNTNNQILFGRRGTGKTHILKVLESEYRNSRNKTTCFIDARLLGSSPQFCDTTLPISHRCSSLFIDILNELITSIRNHIIHNPNDNSDLALKDLEDFSATAFTEIKDDKKIIHKDKGAESRGTTGGIALSSNPSVNFSSTNNSAYETERTEEFNSSEFEKIKFPNLHYFLQKALKHAETDLALIIDEWSAIPFDIQPYLAEFLKKSIIPVPEVTVKIGALEYRSTFTIPREKHNYIGLELGSDISTNLDIDEYFVFDRNPKGITNTFANVLLKHIESELPKDYLENTYKITSSKSLIKLVLSGNKAFEELVRASEGVIRDFINIFTMAFFDSQRNGAKKISKKMIIEASRQWFENDKSKNIDDKLYKKIHLIIDEVIGKKKARSFMVSRALEKHQVIQQLYDARIIHLVKKGYSDKDTPGKRYNIYSLDYGTYVDLLNTSSEPQIQFEFMKEFSADVVVPFDDNRSIRRIILTEEILN